MFYAHHQESQTLTPQQWKSLRPETLHVVMQRYANGYDEVPIHDTPFDHFMWDYIGDPKIPGKSRIQQSITPSGEVRTHDQQIISAVSTSGLMVYLAGDSSAECNDTSRYFAVTSNIYSGKFAKWNVVKEEFTAPYSYQRPSVKNKQLYLAEEPLGLLPAKVIADFNEDPVGHILDAQDYENRLRNWSMSKLRLTLSNEYYTLQQPNGYPENFTDLQTIVTQLACQKLIAKELFTRGCRALGQIATTPLAQQIS
ncbi:MAG: hypothetical protein NVS1B7_2270 [Candidatus Saccharimonadales bacterium]